MSPKQKKMLQKLFSALVELANSRDMRDIRVSDIAETAGVHRATFYRHVEDIQDLFERGTVLFWDDLLQSMETERNFTLGFQDNSDIPEYLQFFFRQVLKESDVFKAFLFQQSSNFFNLYTRRRAIDFIEKYRMITILDDVCRYHLAAMIGASLLTTIELVVGNNTCFPYVNTYYSFVKHAHMNWDTIP